MANETVGIDIVARLDQFKASLAKIPGIGAKEAKALTAELAKLTPRERACIVLRYYEDLKVDDIAEWLGISSGAVKRYLSDGLAKMAVALTEEPSSPNPPTTDPQGAIHVHRV